MISANELRVGNIFIRELHTQRGLGYEHEFILTEEWMGKLFGSNIAIALQDLFPIPLTPEILEKCGFKYGMVEGVTKLKDDWNEPDDEGDTEYWDKGKITIVNWGKTGFIVSNSKSFDHRIELKSLHQLQNLYFALTNEELQVNL